MESSESVFPYILIGCIYYTFGLKWCIEYGQLWISTPTRNKNDNPELEAYSLTRSCKKFCTRNPIEGGLKLIFTAIGWLETIISGHPDDDTVSPTFIHVTIYLFFGLSGLVDVLTFYYRRNVISVLGNLALAQSFFVEGFLFIWVNKVDGPASGKMIIQILAATAWITSFIINMEIIWPYLKLLRGYLTILHGGWLAHMVRNHPTVLSYENIALAFSYHIAVAFAITLCVVTITKSCEPKPVQQSQELPV